MKRDSTIIVISALNVRQTIRLSTPRNVAVPCDGRGAARCGPIEPTKPLFDRVVFQTEVEMPFTDKQDLKLIRAVKENPLLYDYNDSLYMDFNAREVVWQKIGDQLKCPGKCFFVFFF